MRVNDARYHSAVAGGSKLPGCPQTMHPSWQHQANHMLLLQAGNIAVPMRPGTGASPSLQAMRERAREAAEAALAEQSAPEHTAVR